jgi:serine/threonine protein kinase
MVCMLCGGSYPAATRFCPADGSVLRPPAGSKEDLVGRIVDDRYYLVEKLGEGGMGDVYLGEHVRTQRRCAVKVVNRQHAHDRDAVSRFVREATNAGRVHHANVATLYDFGEGADGITYLAMEYVEGEPLSRVLLRDGALVPARAVDIARQVADGVGAAHDLGIVHRDLKPSNILIAKDRKGGEVVKVVDFGISRAPSLDEQSLTRTGIVIGTPEYMSPEQLIGDPVDGRSDIYSLGCILYQMLTGEQAFAGPTAQIITRRLTEQPPRPREKNPNIPKPLDDVIVTALGRTPQERFQSMEELRAALLDAPAQPVATGPRRLTAWLGRHVPHRGDADTPDPSAGAVHPHSTPGTPPATAPGTPRATLATPATGPRTGPQGPATPVGGVPAHTVEAPAGSWSPPPLELEQSGAELGATGPLDVSLDGSTGEVPVAGAPDEGLPDDEIPRRRYPVAAMGVGATAVVLLLVMVGLFRAAPEPPAEPLAEQPPALELEAAAVDALWDALALAAQEADSAWYEAAISRLRTAEREVDQLMVVFPGHPELVELLESARSRIADVGKNCEVNRATALRFGTTAPVCDPDQSP